MCRNVIDEINLLVKDFKSKAYRKNDDDDEDAEDSLPAPSEEGEQNELDDAEN